MMNKVCQSERELNMKEQGRVRNGRVKLMSAGLLLFQPMSSFV